MLSNADQILRRLSQDPDYMRERTEAVRAAYSELPADVVVNLAVLAAYLRSLPADYKHFNMSEYFGDYFAASDNPVDCGTVACAVGHGPNAGLPRIKNKYGEMESWGAYEDRLFGGRMYARLFAGGWARVDNTVRGAAARILALIENPENSEVLLDHSRTDLSDADKVYAFYAHMVP